ncbi:MAG: hypothetical protein HOZ81_46805 [Streptomyces sp.]|nr:hypothetical protein [Streptomyces sp.]
MVSLFPKRSSSKEPKIPDSDGDVAGLKTSAWAARIGAHVAELQARLNGVESVELSPVDRIVAEKIKCQLQAVRESIDASGLHVWRSITGRSLDRAITNLHEAEVQLLRLEPEAALKYEGLAVLDVARRHLEPDDPRVVLLNQQLEGNGQVLTHAMRDLAVATLHAAYQAEDQERARVRNFSFIIVAATLIMAALAAIPVILGMLDTRVAARFCFTPVPDEPMVCPLGNNPADLDVLSVALSGMIAAGLAGAVSLRKMQTSSGPYHVGVCLLILRLPVGALSAILGVLLLSGQFFPGLTSLDTSTQIIAWAIAFGILQESVTHAVDKQGQRVLGAVNHMATISGQ